ncbi:hypothetical protein JX266_013603 [Neoarthrinium moseri]|nr:hypothetical protein JX266_013603 [Neoarthrinium moseri]
MGLEDQGASSVAVANGIVTQQAPADINIEVAATATLQSLTLDEFELGQALFKSERAHGGPSEAATVWIRAPRLELAAALKTARDLAVQRKAMLSFNEATDLYDGNFTLNIYARCIKAPDPTKPASIKFKLGKTSTVQLLTPKFPTSVDLVLTGPSEKTETRKPVIEEDKFGISFYWEDGLETMQIGPPIREMKNFNYLDLINANGTMKEQGYNEDEFPRLLQMQRLIAQAHVETNPQLAIELLDYVVAGSASSQSIELHYQAVALRNSLTLGSDLAAASSINIYASKQVLKSRLSAALAFEQAFRDFSNQGASSKFQLATCLDMLAKSNDALETYKFIINIRQREYDNALDAVSKAKASFDKNNSEIEAKGNTFEKGIIGCIIAVAATVATAGAAAPAIVGAGASVVSSVEKAASLIQKIKAIFEKLKEIKEKIEPVLEKLRELVELSKKLMEMIEKLKKGGGAGGDAVTLRPGKQTGEVSDIGLAEWQRFNLAVVDMESQLRDLDIGGKSEYFTSLKTLVIAGECYIKTQVNLVQKTDDLAIVQMQSKMETRGQDRLSSMAYTAVIDDKVFQLLRRAMFDRILTIRTFVYQDFMTYKLAYNYHTLSKKSILRLSPVKPIVDYLQDAATLQGAVATYGSRALVQSRKFTKRSLCGFETAAALGAELSKSGAVDFTIDPQDLIWRGFGRIRMSSARCYLPGAKWRDPSAAHPPLRLELKTSGRFFDRDCAQKAPEGGLGDQTRLVPVRSFVGDERTLLFEYDVASGMVVCDGLWGQERDYTKYTPLTTWRVEVVGYCRDPETQRVLDLDLTGVLAVEMEFVCDVIWSGW